MPPPNLAPRANYNPGSARAWATGWDYALARGAVDEHLRGRFSSSYQLAIDLERHPAAKAARKRRRSAMTAQPWVLRGPDRAPGRIELEAAARTWKKIKALLGAIEDDLAVMGICVVQHPVDLDEDDARYEVQSVEIWPLACVELGSALMARAGGAGPYDPDRLYALVAGGKWEPLPNPGETDLHWTVIGDPLGWRRGAIVACDLEYVASQLARRAWAKLQVALGKASVLLTMPPNAPMVEADENGAEKTTSIGAHMQALAEAMGETQTAGVKPHGAEAETLEVTAQTATLLPDSIDASCRMFALALLGHDSGVTRGSTVYNDPASQSVPEDLARDDAKLIVEAIGALLTGVARLNVERCGEIYPDPQIPDSDQDVRRENVQKRRKADDDHRASLLAAGKAAAELLRAEGTASDPERVAEVYALAGLPPPPVRMPPAAAANGPPGPPARTPTESSALPAGAP